MNGTIYDEIKKNDHSKKKEKLKLIVTIVSTNLLVALLCLNFKGPTTPTIQEKLLTQKTIHSHYKMIVAPLSLLLDPNPNDSETSITLMNKAHKILITKAYLHEEIKNPNKELGGSSRFKIEIPEGELLQLSTDGEETMLAIPELKIPVKNKNPIHRRVSQYEINL